VRAAKRCVHHLVCVYVCVCVCVCQRPVSAAQSVSGYLRRACQDICAERVRIFGQSVSGYLCRACQDICAQRLRIFAQSV
jgi:uncharacterized protein YmfQ (DUF2313 family)